MGTDDLGESQDLYEKDNAIVVKAESHALNKDHVQVDVQVDVEDEDLVIRGPSKAETEANEENYYRMERGFDSLYRRAEIGPM